jgi:hypothetical protein
VINFRILALDPGGTTGWATYSAQRLLNPEGRFEYFEETWDRGQIGPREHHGLLRTLLEMQCVYGFTVVCESFQQYRERDSVNLIPLEYIGVVKSLCQERRVPLTFQSSSQGKVRDNSFVRRKNLLNLGLWYPNAQHAMDATGHLLFNMIHNKGVSTDRKNQLMIDGWK